MWGNMLYVQSVSTERIVMVVNSAAAIGWLARAAPARRLAVAPRLAAARPGGRAVHFIDIENLSGTPDVRIYQAQVTMREYHAAVGIAVGDHVIIGASHHNVIAAYHAWPGARPLMPRSGPDGADEALREVIHTEHIPERFGLVYLGSGDGGFDTDLAFLATAGATTHVVARSHSLSKRLRAAAHHVILLRSISSA
jgi:hypothetical protein